MLLKRSKGLVGLDVGSSAVKLVELRQKVRPAELGVHLAMRRQHPPDEGDPPPHRDQPVHEVRVPSGQGHRHWAGL